MISVDDLDHVLSWMLEAGLQSVSVAEGKARLTLRNAVATTTSPATTVDVTTKAMGVFLPSHPRRSQAALKPGDEVAAGAIVGFLQSGPTLAPIIAGTSGKIMAIIARPGSLLGFGAPVITLGQGG